MLVLDRKWKFLSAAAFNGLLFALFFLAPNIADQLSDEMFILIQGAVNSAIIGLVRDKQL